jgi:hypothetical protein
VVQWFQGPLRPWLSEALAAGSPFEGLLRLPTLRDFLDRRIARGDTGWDEALRFWTCTSALRLARLMENGVP